MNKNRFRLLLVGSIILALLSSAYDYLWPNSVTEQILDFAYELEPEIEGTELVILGVLGVLAIFFDLVSLVGLLLFKNWARHLYLAGFILFAPMYPFLGVSVYGGFSQLLYDTSMLLSGVILALIYYSPVSEYFRGHNLTNQASGTPQSGAPS